MLPAERPPMVKLEDAVIARMDKGGMKFEILVDPELAMELKKGMNINMDELLAFETIFKDANKGEEASEQNIAKAFGTTDVKEIAKKIILQGEVQLTTAQRKEMLEARRREVIATIARDAINPQTNAPHPPLRIENAMNESRITIDPFKSANEQIPAILKEIRKLIPISFEKMRIAVRIPAEFAGKANVILHKYELKQEDWQNDGSLVAVVEVPAGVKAQLFDELNHLTHGTVESKLLENK